MQRLLQIKAMEYLSLITKYEKLNKVGVPEISFAEIHYNILMDSLKQIPGGDRREEKVAFIQHDLEHVYNDYKKCLDKYRAADACMNNSEATIESRIDCAASAMGYLNELFQNFKYLNKLESEIKLLCVADWSKRLTDPETIKGQQDSFAFLVRAVGIVPFNSTLYPIVSTTLFTNEHFGMYREQKMGLIYPMNAENLVFMSTCDSNTMVDSIEQDLGCILDWPIMVGEKRLQCVVSGMDTFRCYDNFRAALSDKYCEIVFNAGLAPTGVLLFCDADDRISKKAEAYANLYEVPLVRYCPGSNKVRV